MMPKPKVELIWLISGISALVLGALVYIMDRNPDTVYFLSDSFRLNNFKTGVFGQFGYHLPTFLHCFALILITAAVIGSKKISAITVSLAWMLIESVFEIAQAHPFSQIIATHTPSWFKSIPVLDNTRNYFLYGKFDVVDLFSIIAGSAVAYILIQLTKRSSSNESPKISTI